MGLHLITGYAGYEHITSNDQGAYNAATFGDGEFVLNRGNKFNATIISNNSVSIADGEAMVQGRFIKMASGTSEEVTIENGTQGMYRNDLICIRYTRNSGTNVEGAELVVLKGTESSSSASDPSHTTGNITDGTDTMTEFPLYRVSLNGINIASVTSLFSVKTSMVDYMDNYQTPNATKSSYGVVKIGDGLNVNNGVVSNAYSLPTASATQLGGVKIGNGITLTNGVISLGLTYVELEYELRQAITIGASQTYCPYMYLKNTAYNQKLCVNFIDDVNKWYYNGTWTSGALNFKLTEKKSAVPNSAQFEIQNQGSSSLSLESGTMIKIGAWIIG